MFRSDTCAQCEDDRYQLSVSAITWLCCRPPLNADVISLILRMLCNTAKKTA